MRDLYTSLGFFTALKADVYSAEAEGETVDILGFDAANLIVTTASFASAGAPSDQWTFKLQHGLASEAGVSAWSFVAASLMLHSVYGLNGDDPGRSDGEFYRLSLSGDVGTYMVGYRGDGKHRYLRVLVSVSGGCSSFWGAGVAINGLKHQWPVNETK
jgi:hypothetical protein